MLELSDVNKAVLRLDDDEKLIRKLFVSGQNRDVTVINGTVLYTLIMRSTKEKAKEFRKWVTSEVLPFIRKHGAYITPEKIEDILSDPDTIIQLAQTLKAERAKRAELEAKVIEDSPKVLFADSVSASKTAILVGDLAKILKQNGVD